MIHAAPVDQMIQTGVVHEKREDYLDQGGGDKVIHFSDERSSDQDRRAEGREPVSGSPVCG